jgi:flagellar basal-body rod modification protein FlgD
MDIRHTSSITGVGSPAASRVASSLSPRPATTSKTTGTAKPMAASTTSSAAADSSDITSSDFLTLLVSELQNQDPTQPADPNAYITQLVQVNSLQQLIQINQTGQLAGGDTVALLNDIDSTIDPNSPVATPSTPPTSGSGSNANSVSQTDSGANANPAATAKEITSVDPGSGLQLGVNNPNALWGAAVSS